MRFRNGEIYGYFDFPEDQYQAFLQAESRGRHFLSHIRGRFRYQRLARSSASLSSQDGRLRTLTLGVRLLLESPLL